MQKKQSVTDRWTDLLTYMVTYRDANVAFNSLDTQICASLPLNSLKTQKKQSGTDRPTDRQTDIVTCRVACTRLKKAIIFNCLVSIIALTKFPSDLWSPNAR